MNVEFILAEIEALPLADSSVDLVISNGVFNLCPDKPRVLERSLPRAEARWTAPDGRHPAGAACHARGGGSQGLVVGLNRRGGVGAVAPGDAEGGGIRGWGFSRLDRVSNVVVYPGGAGVSEEATEQP